MFVPRRCRLLSGFGKAKEPLRQSQLDLETLQTLLLKMNKAGYFILCFWLLPLAACNNGSTSSNSANTAATANSNQPAPSATGNTNSSNPADAAAAKTTEPARLIGTYESREVHDQGVVTLITQLKTRWKFSEDGTYQRQSEVKGKAYHADSGTFRIEQPDKLILTIQLSGIQSNRKIETPPLTRVHVFSLSPDGNELRLTSAKGSIGIFERIAKPTAQ